MYRNLRIICSIISALLVAACVFVFVYLGMVWGFVCLIAAAAFFALTVLFKRKQEQREERDNPPPPKGDFITGAVVDKREKSDKHENNDKQ